jgi:hypothetical protein
MKTKKPKPGRPALPKNQVKNVVAIRLSDSGRSEYEKRAASQGSSAVGLDTARFTAGVILESGQYGTVNERSPGP